MRVRATALGFYGNQRRRIGDEFTIRSEKDFSEKWMEKIEARAPRKEAKKPQRKAAAKPKGPQTPTGDAQPI